MCRTSSLQYDGACRVQGEKEVAEFGGALTKSVEFGLKGLVSSPDLCLVGGSLPVNSEHHPPAARGYRLSMAPGRRLGDGPVERV